MVYMGFGFGVDLMAKKYRTGMGSRSGESPRNVRGITFLDAGYVVIGDILSKGDGEVRKARVPGCCLFVITCGAGGTGGAFAGRVWA